MTNWKKKLTKEVQRTFSMCEIRLLKAPLSLGSLVCADCLTQESYCCALCSSHSWHRVSQISAGLYPTWEASRITTVLGKDRRESMPRGKQKGVCRWWKESLATNPSSCNAASTTKHPGQPLPSKGHHPPSLGLHRGLSWPVSYHPNTNN